MSQTIVVETPEPEVQTSELIALAHQTGQTTEAVSNLETQLQQHQAEVEALKERLQMQETELQQLRNQPPIVQEIQVQAESEPEPEIELITPPEPEPEPEPQPIEPKKTHWLMEWLLN